MADKSIYKVEQYLDPAQYSNQNFRIVEANQILYASTFLSGAAAMWWSTLDPCILMPTTWIDFKVRIRKECFPERPCEKNTGEVETSETKGLGSQCIYIWILKKIV